MTNLSSRYAELGQGERALAATTDAVSNYRRLSEQRPDIFLPTLGRTLNNLAGQLGTAGRRQEGLAAITEAIQIFSRLTEQSPAACADGSPSVKKCSRGARTKSSNRNTLGSVAARRHPDQLADRQARRGEPAQLGE